MCNQAVDNYVDALEYVPECFKTQEMCDKVVDTCPFVFDSIPDRYKTHKLFSEDSFMLKYFFDRF